MKRFVAVKGGLAVFAALALCACAARSDRVTVAGERACYRTLARVDCHARPLPGEDARRVGFFDWAALEMGRHASIAPK